MGKIGIVFSGGIGKGAYEVGFCRAFNALVPFEHVNAVSCSSIGCINGYAFSTGQLETVEEIWKSADYRSMKEFYSNLIKRPVILNYIDRFKDDITEIPFPLIVNCIQIPSVKLRYIDISKMQVSRQKEMLKACISIPTVMSPVEVAGKKYLDGAMLDNTPVCALQAEACDVILVLRFDHSVKDYSMIHKESTVIEVVFKDDHFIKNSFSLDKESTQFMIDQGEKYTEQVLKTVFKQGYDDAEYFRYAATLYNRGSRERLIPRNGDDVVRKINKLTKIFRA